MLARIVVRSVSLLHKSGTNKRQLATAAKPPSNTPLGAPDGPTAEDMERFNMSKFASLSFREQMAEFKTVMLRQDVRRPVFCCWCPVDVVTGSLGLGTCYFFYLTLNFAVKFLR